MDPILTDRDKTILGAVIEEFVQTAEPVGSRHLTRKYGLGLSPATVRNVMSDLEERGLLTQPHTSAGRVPTNQAYRFYVDHLRGGEQLDTAARRRLRRVIAQHDGDLESLLEMTSKALGAAAGQVGLVAAPRFDARIFRHIDFVRLREGWILVVLVARSGVVEHRPVRAPEVSGQAELDRMSAYLDELLEGVPLSQVREKILTEMAGEKALYDRLFQRALRLGESFMGSDLGEEDLFLGDRARLLDQPEFNDVARMRAIFEAFEKKGLILKLLDRASGSAGVQVLIGEESHVPTLQGCSVVSSPYRRRGEPVGALGVIGPTRMDYPRVIGLVEYTAKLLGEVIETI